MTTSRSRSPSPAATSLLASSFSGSISSAFAWTLRHLSSDEGINNDAMNVGRRDKRDNGGNDNGGNNYSRPDALRPHRRPSPYAPPPLSPLTLSSTVGPDSQILTETLAEEIRLLVPPRLQLHETWTLMYNLEQHGVSLSTLYGRQGKGAFVLLVKDLEGGIFGAYVNEEFRPSARYYGTGECFLWKAVYIPSTQPEEAESLSAAAIVPTTLRFKAFPYSGVNDYMIFCDHTFLSLGGGDGHYGLWLDDNLLNGVSSYCPTYGNEPLSLEGEKFEILGVELWRVGPASN